MPRGLRDSFDSPFLGMASYDRRVRQYAAPTSVRVTARYLKAMEHSSPEALKEYLREHPGADPKNHSVGKGKGDSPSKDEAKADSFKGKSKGSWAKGDVLNRKLQKMQGQLDKLVNGYKTSNPAKAKEVAEKFETDAKSSLSNFEVALHHAESAHNLSGKDKARIEKAKKVVNDLKDAVKGGAHGKDGKPSPSAAGNLVEKLFDASEAVSGIWLP